MVTETLSQSASAPKPGITSFSDSTPAPEKQGLANLLMLHTDTHVYSQGHTYLSCNYLLLLLLIILKANPLESITWMKFWLSHLPAVWLLSMPLFPVV